MNIKKKKRGFRLILISSLIIPALQVLFIIGCNSSNLIKNTYLILIGVLESLFLLFLVFGINLFVQNKTANRRKLKRWLKVCITIFMSLYILGCVAFVVLLYGNNDKFRTWLITTAMQTMNHQYLCKWFYNNTQIDDVLSKNYVLESGQSTNTDLITKDESNDILDEYDKEILDFEKGSKYKIIQLEIDGQKAYLAVIYDPSMISLRVTEAIGERGEYVTKMAEKSKAILAINGGGFNDPSGCSWGGTPNGITISNGKIVTNTSLNSSGGIIGFNNDDVLVLLKNTSAEEALEMGVRDAVTWGPFLIVNGESSQISGNGGWGYGARTAIGQRKDGIVLFLVVNSNSSRTRGADMADLTDVMLRYHAVNAANLDGGTSSLLALPRDIAIKEYGATCHDYYTNYACAINDPIDSEGIHQTRFVADAWVVTE